MSRPILVCGAGGQVGQALTARLIHDDREVVAFDRRALDIGDTTCLRQIVSMHRPRVVINAAAYTAVDRAETDADVAHAINVEAPRRLAEVCAEIGAALLSYSTDYVFDGTKSAPYLESDPVNPINVYGRSKALGDDAIRATLERHVIVRTSWVFAPGRPNFVTTMLRLAAERATLSVVNEEFGCPTAASDIAGASVALIEAMDRRPNFPWGTYHFCGAGPTSRHGFATAVVEEAAAVTGRKVEVVPIASADFPTAARRPLNAVLDCSLIARTFGLPQPDWRAPLAHMVRAFHRNRMADQ